MGLSGRPLGLGIRTGIGGSYSRSLTSTRLPGCCYYGTETTAATTTKELHKKHDGKKNRIDLSHESVCKFFNLHSKV